MSYFQYRLRAIKMQLRMARLRTCQRINRATNDRIVEKLANIARKMDERQDAANLIYVEEIGRIEEQQKARKVALQTALRNIPAETRAMREAVDQATTI